MSWPPPAGPPASNVDQDADPRLFSYTGRVAPPDPTYRPHDWTLRGFLRWLLRCG